MRSTTPSQFTGMPLKLKETNQDENMNLRVQPTALKYQI